MYLEEIGKGKNYSRRTNKTRAKDNKIQIVRATTFLFGQLSANSRRPMRPHPVLRNLTHIIHHRLWRLDTGEDGAWPLHCRRGVALRAQQYHNSLLNLTCITPGAESREPI